MSDTARVCLVSLRGVERQAAWCSNYEFEDVIAEVDAVDMRVVQPGPGYDVLQWAARRAIWRPGVRQLVRYVRPGVKRIKVERHYELFVFVCMNPSDLLYLAAVDGWRSRCKKAVCIMVEFYARWEREYAFHLRLLDEFDHVALCFDGSVDTVARTISAQCHHLPLGVDVSRFSPFPEPPNRSIDVYSIGRRPEALHSAMLALAREERHFYLHDTIPGVLIQPRDHAEHRTMYARCAQRSRLFVAYPAKVDVEAETRGQSEVGARFFEGAASGAVMIGQAPTASTFEASFSWPDAVVKVGQTEESIQDAVVSLLNDPERRVAIGRSGVAAAHRGFDWAHRWKEVLGWTGLAPLDPLVLRIRRLRQGADQIEGGIALPRAIAGD